MGLVLGRWGNALLNLKETVWDKTDYFLVGGRKELYPEKFFFPPNTQTNVFPKVTGSPVVLCLCVCV